MNKKKYILYIDHFGTRKIVNENNEEIVNPQSGTLLVLDKNLFLMGKKIFLKFNFEKIIFVPEMILYHLVLLDTTGKTYILIHIGKFYILGNRKSYSFFYKKEIKLESLNYLDLSNLEYKKIYSWDMEIITKLRKFKKLIILLDICFVLYILYILYSR